MKQIKFKNILPKDNEYIDNFKAPLIVRFQEIFDIHIKMRRNIMSSNKQDHTQKVTFIHRAVGTGGSISPPPLQILADHLTLS